MCKEVIKVSLLQKGQNDRITNIVSVVYGIQCSLDNFELSSNIMTNSSPEDNTPSSKTDGLVHTLLRKTFSTPEDSSRYQTNQDQKEWICINIRIMKCQVEYNFSKYLIGSNITNVGNISVVFYLIILICRILDIAEAHNVFDNMDFQGIRKMSHIYLVAPLPTEIKLCFPP